jgi:beta-N-acetylhexosaminidase
MLCNGGSIAGKQFFKPETISFFTSYGSDKSRRGFGFDKPEKYVVQKYMDRDTLVRKDNYPAMHVSPATFGHTGYTGTCVWADPDNKIVFVFLSNRVHPDGGANGKLLSMNVRGKVQDAIYKALMN